MDCRRSVGDGAAIGRVGRTAARVAADAANFVTNTQRGNGGTVTDIKIIFALVAIVLAATGR